MTALRLVKLIGIPNWADAEKRSFEGMRRSETPPQHVIMGAAKDVTMRS
jgi:hypothetical protein